MSIVLFLATVDNYFRTGVSNLPLLQNNGYKIFDFYNIIRFNEISSLYNKNYIVCDRNNYVLFDAVFSRPHVECINKESIFFIDDNLIISKDTPPPWKIISDLNNAEKLILYLYVIQGMKIEDIARITNLSVKKIYYRIRTIKIKFGVNTTQKLSILFKDCFLSY
ncbi:sigma-70 family RNA polymerase sigma factor [Escherichia coli]|nr:sigma-70 family RNA polymerase sigma factor [Escherichia coli]EGI3961152.1 sigma-70 family RNA polymerase sigma factor [Escherichia coli]EGI3975517.1 sigma-70 family RNA polymerase sigma factor [Escherichia coli]EGI3984793.1 sigma-70 family RNA polymerase sigma factor [Escherichia coli]